MSNKNKSSHKESIKGNQERVSKTEKKREKR